MQGKKRRIVQAILYEAVLLSLFIPIAVLVFKQNLVHSAGLGFTLTLMALIWNVIFNYYFERFEAKHGWQQRKLKQRLLHAISFEGGFFLLSAPVIALFLNISLLQAIIADIGITLAIMVYTFIFQWCFDHIFGEPERISWRHIHKKSLPNARLGRVF